MENPVLAKELRIRLRSLQSVPVRWSVGLVIVAIILLCYQQAIGALLKDGTVDTAKGAWVGAFFIQTTLIWLFCPALAANAVTQEKEQQTWEMLVFSLLTPLQILSGKLIVRMLPIVLLLLAFVPFNLFCVYMGGAHFSDLILAYLVFAIWIAFMTTVSLFMSWAFRKTASAISMSYLVLFALAIGTLLLEATLSAGAGSADSPIIWLNPGRVASALIDPTDYKAGRVILLSSLTYLSISAFLFWRMVTQFRTFSVD